MGEGGRYGGGKKSDASGFKVGWDGVANVRTVGLSAGGVVLMGSWVGGGGEMKESLHGVAWKTAAGAAVLLDGKGVAAGGEW